MNEEEFGRAVQRVYDAALKAGKTEAQAHKLAEAFRSNLIKAIAQTALNNKGETSEAMKR